MSMGWVKLDANFPDHPKVIRAGPDAAWLYVCALTWSARLMTDGYIPAGQVPRLSALKKPQALANRLVEVQLWELVEGGYLIHDYTDWQTDAATQEERRRKDSERKRSGIKTESERNPLARSRSRKEVPPLPPQPSQAPNGAATGGEEATSVEPRSLTRDERAELGKFNIERIAEVRQLMAKQRVGEA